MQAILLLILISLLWGSGWIFGPQLAEVAPPFASAALVLGLACAVLAGASWMLAMRRTSRHGVPLRTSVMLCLFMLALPSSLLVLAGMHGVGGWPLLVYALLPLAVALMEDRWSSVMVFAAGAVFVLVDNIISFAGRTLLWCPLLLAAVVLQAAGMRFAARTLRSATPADLLVSTMLQTALAALVLAGFSLLFDPRGRIAAVAQWNAPVLISLCALAILGTALPYTIFYWLLGRSALRPEQVAAGQWLQTLCAVAESAVFARAHVPWLIGAAALGLVFGTVSILSGPAEAGPVSIAPSSTSRENSLR